MKKLLKSALSLVLLLCMLLCTCSCAMLDQILNGSNVDQAPSDSNTPPADESKDDTVDEDNDDALWNLGYIGSDRNAESKNSIDKSDNNYSYTDVITVEKSGTRISFTDIYNLAGERNVYTLSFWKRVNDKWVLDTEAPNLRSDSNSAVAERKFHYVEYSYVTSRDGECIRFCYYTGNPKLLNGNHPEIEITETEERGTLANEFEVLDFTVRDRERAYYGVLEGKSINFIGDSLFAGHSLGKAYTWPSLISAKYGMQYSNHGISGCTLSACEGGENPIINRYKEMPDNDPDIVVFEGGRNDFNKAAALGSTYGGDITTYRGALSALIDGLREKYPKAVIVGVTFWKANSKLNSADISCDEYSNAMMEVCSAKGVSYIDATDQAASGIYMTDAAFRQNYSLAPSDVCHLNFEGMKLALRFFERELARIYTEYTSE